MDLRSTGVVRLLVNAAQVAFAVAWTAALIVVALGARILTRDHRASLRMAHRRWAPALIRAFGIRLEVRGREHVDFTRPHLFAANHQSLVDVVVLYAALPAELVFVLKEELARWPFLGWYVRAMGMILIRRSDRHRSIAALRQSDQCFAEGKSVLAFPEGTRSRDGRLNPFKAGVFVPALSAAVPVVPVAVDGAGAVLPRGGLRIYPGRVRVTVGRPIPTAGLTVDDRRALAQRVRDEIEAALASVPAPE